MTDQPDRILDRIFFLNRTGFGYWTTVRLGFPASVLFQRDLVLPPWREAGR